MTFFKSSTKNVITKKCYIIGASGDVVPDFVPLEDDFVIAADGGYNALTQAGIRIDILVGDFDSLNFVPSDCNVIRLPSEKDITDVYAAVSEGMQRGYTDFVFYGVTGGRIDHTIANIQILSYLASKTCNGVIITPQSNLTAIKNKSIEFPSNYKGLLSTFSIGEKAAGVTLSGLKYTLNNYTLVNTFPIGVSNEFIGQKATITVADGTLLIIYDRQREID